MNSNVRTHSHCHFLSQYENILTVHDESGYNLLQKSVGLNHVELLRWILQRHRPDVNRSPCSLPLHIACLKGNEECVELLLKYGARIDTEARMCFPGPHCNNCEASSVHRRLQPPDDDMQILQQIPTTSNNERYNTKLQNAVCYAIDGDQIGVLNILSQKMEEPWFVGGELVSSDQSIQVFFSSHQRVPFRVKKPLLHLACERGAWKCVQQLVITRSEEINLIKDEYYPIHQAVLHDGRFLELLIQHGAITTVRTCTQQMTLLHVGEYGPTLCCKMTEIFTIRIHSDLCCEKIG